MILLDDFVNIYLTDSISVNFTIRVTFYMNLFCIMLLDS